MSGDEHRPLTATVTVPATTANLGPGFDCLGLALGLHNRLTITKRAGGVRVIVTGEGESFIPTGEQNLARKAAERLFRHVGRRPDGWELRQENQIPVGSGLGSSAAAVVGGLLAANEVVGGDLTNNELLELASDLEGHPDNVAPALLGGLVLVGKEDGRYFVEPIPIPEMRVAFILPAFRLPTKRARKALPFQVPLSDAIFNAGRLGLLIRALENQDYGKLAKAMQDRLHQPYRLSLIPGMAQAFEAAREAGASAVALSGAGPGMVAFAPDNLEDIARAAQRAFDSHHPSSRSWILPTSSQGAQLIRSPAR